MKSVLDQAKDLINQKKYEQAKRILDDGNTYEQWREKFGSHLTAGIAYCQMFDISKGKVDVQEVRKTLSTITENQAKDLENAEDNFWFNCLIEIDNELNRLEQLEEVDEVEE